VDEAERAFLDGYSRGATLPDPHRLRLHEAISMLKIVGRRLRNLDVHEWHLLEPLLGEAEQRIHRATAPVQEPRAQHPSGPARVSAGDRTSSRARPTAHARAVALPERLATALDPDAMSAVFEPLLDGRPSPVVGADLVRTRPRRRWTIRYRLAGTERGLIGKVYADEVRGRWVHDTLARFSTTGTATSRPRVPTVLGWIPGLSMMVSVEAPGRDLAELLVDPAVPFREPIESTAAWLAALHSSGIRIDRSFDAIEERDTVRRWAHEVDRWRSGSGVRADELARSLDERLSGYASFSGRVVPIHKDFHAQQVIVDPDGVTVLDFDEMRMGDAAFDLAHFCANAELLVYRYSAAAMRIDRARTMFVQGYRRRADHDLPAESFDVSFAYTCLKIAWQLSIDAGLGPQPHPASEEAVRQAGFMLERGLLSLEQRSRR
ncbi:MAG TPA: phosphotransferase, partial [Actinomycetota bacterium]